MKNLLFILFLAFLSINSYSQYGRNVEYNSCSKIIKIHSENKFISYNKIKGKTLNDEVQIEIIYDDLETIKNFKIVTFTGNKKSIKRAKEFQDESVITESFYTGLKRKYITLPKKCNFVLTFKVEYQDFNFIHAPDNYQISTFDTINITYCLPIDRFYLSYKIDTANENTIKLSKNYKFNDSIYNFSIINNINKKVKPKDRLQTLSLKNSLRTIILPIYYKNRQNIYYCNWYLNLVEKNIVLSDSSKLIIDTLTKNIDDSIKIIEFIYNYVRDKIRYIDIENGYDAVKLRDVNKILNRKYGDCKDMAGLLYALLKYKGFDAKLALASTIGHPYNFDFVSMQSANHLICFLKYKNNKYFLDATDKASSFNDYPISTNGKEIFIIDKNGGFKEKIPLLDVNKQLFSNTFNLVLKNDSIYGYYVMKIHGIASKQLYYIVNATKPDSLNELKLYWNILTDRLNSSDFTVKYCSDTLIVLSSTISIKKTFLQKTENNLFLSLNCFPFAHNLPLFPEDEYDVSNYIPVNSNTIITIKNKDNKSFQIKSEDSSFSESGFEYSYLTKSTQKDIYINYSFKYPNSIILSDDTKTLIKLNKTILNNYNNAIKIY